MNYNLKLDLLKLQGAFLAEIKIDGEQKKGDAYVSRLMALECMRGKRGYMSQPKPWR